MKNSIKSKLLTTGMALFALCAFADPATGWKQTGAGTYDYNNTDNWVDGKINGVFSSDLELTAAQTITFSADTQLPDGLSIAQTGAFAITFASDDASAPRTLTLGGGYTNNGAGDVVFDASVVLDLGGDTRTLTSAKKLTLSCVVQNGGVVFDGAGAVVVNGANTYAGGTTLNGSGTVYQANTSAFGTGRFTFGEGSKLCARVSSFATAVPITLAGSFTWTTDQKKNQNMGNGDITILKPLTASIESGYTLTLGGQVAADSPCDITAITKAGNGSLGSPSTIVLSNGEEKTLNVSGGNFYFSGTITGEGTFVKAGGGYLELSGDSNPFEGTFVIKAGSVRHKYAKSLPSNAKFLILDTGVLRSNTSKDGGYRTAALLLPLVDTKSTGILGISSNEGGDMDLTDYPNLVIAPNGDTFQYSGNITAPSTGVLRIGGGGKTLKLSGTISGATEIDASTGSIQFDVSQTNFDGTITCGAGFTLLVGSSAELSTADLVSNGGTIRFAAAKEGEFVRARSVTLNTAHLTIDSPSAGAVSHRISGALKTGVYEKSNGGTSRVTMTNSGANDSTLSVGSMSNVKGAEMLNIVYDTTATGASKLFVESVPAMVGTGALGTIYAPVIPFVRVDNGLATYDPAAGVRALAAGEYTVYEAGYEGPVLHSGENLATTGNGTITLTGSASVNSIWMMGASSSDQTLAASEGVTLTVASGAMQVNSYGAAVYSVSTDFVSRRGYFSGRAGVVWTLSGAISGSGGITFADNSLAQSSKGVKLNTGADFSGDCYVFGYCWFESVAGSFFPNGTERLGDMYDFGYLQWKGTNVRINGLNGAGRIYQDGSSTGSLTTGCDGSGGNYVGTFVNGKSNFGLTKEGSGTQRFDSTMVFKWTCTVNGGNLQVDGTLKISTDSNSSYNIIVKDGATLSGCGTIGGYSYERVESGATLAPGSEEIPNRAMTLAKELRMEEGASMKFYIGNDRVSQAIVAEGYGVTGTATSIPVTVNCEASKPGTWMLLEADTFNGKTFALTPRVQGGHLLVLTDEATNRAQLWFEKTVGLSIIIR